MMFVYTLFAADYFFFADTREYMLGQDMLLIYLFFIPMGIFVVKEIRSWDGYEKIWYPFAAAAILLNTAVFLSAGRETLSYMEVSYSLLPFLAVLYSYSRSAEKRRHKIVSFLLFAAGTVEILAFGARGPILFLLIFLFLYEMLRTDATRSKKALLAVVGVSLISVLAIFGNSIIARLSETELFADSYILQNLSGGDFLQHRSRTLITQRCLSRIGSMGLEVSGLFGDRAYCGSVYPHNIVYELLMSLGWVLGTAAILLLLGLILPPLFKKDRRMIAVFLITTLFLRFFVSGSYLIEGKFWIFLFALLSLRCQNKKAVVSGETVG